jgi:hypothetical protein
MKKQAKPKLSKQMQTIERMYGKDFGNTKLDKKFGNYLKEAGCPGLAKLLNID